MDSIQFKFVAVPLARGLVFRSAIPASPPDINHVRDFPSEYNPLF